MKDKDLYTHAHLIIAATRVLEHQDSAPPSIDAVCQTLSFSLEQALFICRKLKEMGVVDMVEGAYGIRIFIKNHAKIEEIPRGTKESKFEDELKKFKDTQKQKTQEIESFQAKQEKKQKDLFAELEKKMKADLEKNKKDS
jgi:hypothetical protein